MLFLEVIVFLLLGIPFIKMVVFDQEQILIIKELIFYLCCGMITCFLGWLYFHYIASDNAYLIYFWSQSTLSFLICYYFISYPYKALLGRIPEISKAPEKLVDIIPSVFVLLGTILLPILIDNYVFRIVAGTMAK